MDPLRLWVDLILPLGAFLTGFVASIGFFIGGRISQYPPNLKLFALMMVAAIACVVGFDAMEYLVLAGVGGPLHALGLGDFLAYRFTHSAMQIGRSSHAQPIDLGSGGFLLPLGNLIGFAGGMASGFWMLRLIPRCAKCAAYFKIVKRGGIKFEDEHDVETFLQGLPQQPDERFRALERFETGILNNASGNGKWTFQFNLNRCPGCHDQFVREGCMFVDGKRTRDIKRFTLRYEVGTIRREPPPAPPRPQFGRKLA